MRASGSTFIGSQDGADVGIAETFMVTPIYAFIRMLRTRNMPFMFDGNAFRLQVAGMRSVRITVYTSGEFFCTFEWTDRRRHTTTTNIEDLEEADRQLQELLHNPPGD